MQQERKPTGFWPAQVAQMRAEGMTPKEYAAREGLNQQHLSTANRRYRSKKSIVPSSEPRRFVSVSVAQPTVPVHCRVVVGSALALEMDSLPSPMWLVELSQRMVAPRER